MSRPQDDKERREASEGWESLAEEGSEGSLTPSPELEEALREAAEAVEAREQARRASGSEPAGGEGATVRAELQALQERNLRLQADFENQRRRALKERQEAYQYGHENLVKDLLGTVDNLDRAIDHASQSGGGDFESILQGVELVRRDLLGALAKHGVSEIEAQGLVFDPNVHEAIAQHEDDTVPAGTVVQVYQKGYRLRDRLLRPARVVVSKRTSGAEQGAGDSPGRDGDA